MVKNLNSQYSPTQFFMVFNTSSSYKLDNRLWFAQYISYNCFGRTLKHLTSANTSMMNNQNISFNNTRFWGRLTYRRKFGSDKLNYKRKHTRYFTNRNQYIDFYKSRQFQNNSCEIYLSHDNVTFAPSPLPFPVENKNDLGIKKKKKNENSTRSFFSAITPILKTDPGAWPKNRSTDLTKDFKNPDPSKFFAIDF